MAGPRPRASAPSRIPPLLLSPHKILHKPWPPPRRVPTAAAQHFCVVEEEWGKGGTMMPPESHPLVHPYPAPVVAPPVPAPAPAPAALQVQGPAPAPAPAPAAVPAQGQGNANAPPVVLMRALPGEPGTRIGLALRLAQILLAATALGAMVSTGHDYTSVTGFNYFVPAVALQCMWSLAMASVDVYAILVGRSFRNPRVVGILSVGDWITGALTFSAASASAGITTFINDDLESCYDNPCPNFMAATAMAFLSSFLLAPCCILNLGQMIYKLQRP